MTTKWTISINLLKLIETEIVINILNEWEWDRLWGDLSNW